MFVCSKEIHAPARNYISENSQTGIWDEKAIKAKRNLNTDFQQNARLLNAVRVYHYFSPGGHAAISVSGRSYDFYPFGFRCKEEPIEKAIDNAKNGGVPIWEGRVSISPEKLLDETTHYACLDCSEAICRLLLQEIHPKIMILPPISLSPALARWRWSQLVDNRNVFPGVIHENNDDLPDPIVVEWDKLYLYR